MNPSRVYLCYLPSYFSCYYSIFFLFLSSRSPKVVQCEAFFICEFGDALPTRYGDIFPCSFGARLKIHGQTNRWRTTAIQPHVSFWGFMAQKDQSTTAVINLPWEGDVQFCRLFSEVFGSHIVFLRVEREINRVLRSYSFLWVHYRKMVPLKLKRTSVIFSLMFYFHLLVKRYRGRVKQPLCL